MLRDASHPRPRSGERMRALRERQRKGLVVVPFQIRDSEIHALVRRGLLDAGLRHDRWEIARALGTLLDQVLAR